MNKQQNAPAQQSAWGENVIDELSAALIEKRSAIGFFFWVCRSCQKQANTPGRIAHRSDCLVNRAKAQKLRQERVTGMLFNIRDQLLTSSKQIGHERMMREIDTALNGAGFPQRWARLRETLEAPSE